MDRPCVYTEPGGSGTDRIAVWYQMGPLMKVILGGTVPFQFRTGPVKTERIPTRVDPILNGSEHIRACVNVALISNRTKFSNFFWFEESITNLHLVAKIE